MLAVVWLFFEENRNRISGEALQVVSYPIVFAVTIMAFYENKIRSLKNRNRGEKE